MSPVNTVCTVVTECSFLDTSFHSRPATKSIPLCVLGHIDELLVAGYGSAGQISGDPFRVLLRVIDKESVGFPHGLASNHR